MSTHVGHQDMLIFVVTFTSVALLSLAFIWLVMYEENGIIIIIFFFFLAAVS